MNKFIKTVNKNKISYEFLRGLNGLMDLSYRELDLFSNILKIEMNRNDNPDGFVDTAKTRKKLREETMITADNMSRYIKGLLEKGLLIKNEDSETVMNEALIPIIKDNKVIIEFILEIKNDENV